MLKFLGEKVSDIHLSVKRGVLRLRGTIKQLFSTVPQRLMLLEESRREHAGIIVDLFAAIMSRVKGVMPEDMDATMDILRYDFPNVEHRWLIKRFEQAYRADYPLDAALALASGGRTEAERISLLLEIFAMLHRVGGDLTDPHLFEAVSVGLNLPGMAQIINKLMSTPGAEAEKPMESISFSSKLGEAHFLLSPSDADIRFRAMRCANLLLIVNDGPATIKLRSRRLYKGGILPLSTGQSLDLPSGPVTYKGILYLLQARYSGLKMVNYLQMDGENVIITQQRSLHSLARVRMGVHVEIDILKKDTQLELNGHLIKHGESVCTNYYEPFTVKGFGPYLFSELNEHGSMERSFQLDPGNRVILVTNLPATNRPGALMLRPGLAPGFVIEVSYSRKSNTGSLRVLEGGSSLLVDNVPVRTSTIALKDGDLITMSSVQSLRCRFSMGVLDEESSTITQLDVQGVTRDFLRAGRVVDNIDFSLQRGEMACILGPSGSGKSTLLRMLAGHLRPSFGAIFYNGERITPDSLNLRRHIAFIPREDILDESMQVGEHLVQASIARRPLLSKADRMRRILAVLNFLDMGHLTKRQVGSSGERTISDGERTRLNLGLDLTGTAEVFLVDEPISGLSSADAERVIKTLQDIADDHILVCTLHRPATAHLLKFDKVMVLDAHGQMAYWGKPQNMVRYFSDAARDLGLNVPPEIVAAGGADYVFEVLNAPYSRVGRTRKQNSKIWQERYESYIYRNRNQYNYDLIAQNTNNKPVPNLPRRGIMEHWRLFSLWCTRTFLGRIRSRMGLYALLLEGPVLALLISGTLREASEYPYTFYKALHINEYLFLSLVLAMFFGLTDAACEVLRDRPVLRRESNYKLFISGYLMAKVLILSLIASTQCALYLLVSNWVLEIHSMFWSHLAVMSLTAFVGIALSLMVSALVKTERVALNIVPLLLVPQILLAGAMIPFEQMNEFSPNIPSGILPKKIEHGFTQLGHRVAYQDQTTHDIKTKPIPLIAEFCPLRYAFEMMFVQQTENNRWEVESSRITSRREYLKEHGTEDAIRFIQRAVLALNATAPNEYAAQRFLRRTRKAALSNDEEFLERILDEQDQKEDTSQEQPLEFFYTNRKLTSVREGVKTARKDARLEEGRGFFLSPRQPRAFQEMNQGDDTDSVSTIKRNAIYLFIMGFMPLMVVAWKLHRIVRGK